MSLKIIEFFTYLLEIDSNVPYEPELFFVQFFKSYLRYMVVQLGITFDTYTKIHLNDGKYQIYLIIVETPT